MKKNKLGEFQELVLMSVVILQENAYGNEIERYLEKCLQERQSMGAIQTALKRMEEKGYLTSKWGEVTQKRGGKRKRIYTATPMGVKVLRDMRDLRTQMWSAMPDMAIGGEW
ncbi:PadR family transcriptional regulator [Roseivirga misakiensis]|uniref:PadR family transcriptional regulator n=1 Tax=Roseivirga misakiensis TaxID=1563681 RepID=A0A1E5T726_9BACT|nr:PadR family transcriptional regulator [Roseivirga misakiensis]OEK07181.1 PadR family transcriptional regulator [Roseivirga misakiensis]